MNAVFFTITNDLTCLSRRMQTDDPTHASEWQLVGSGVRRLLDIALTYPPPPEGFADGLRQSELEEARRG